MKKLIFSICVSLVLVSCAKKDDKITIGSVVFDENGEWYEEAMQGIRDAAEESKVKLAERNSHYDINAERELVRELLKKDKAKAIVICPISEKESGSTLAEAQALGIKSVTWNTTVHPDVASKIIVDSTRLGAATGEYVCKRIRESGRKDIKVALITNATYEIGVARCKGFRDSIQPLVDDGTIEIVYETNAELTEETSVAVKRMLKERSDVDFVWCWNQTSLLATIKVLKDENKNNILIAGTDMSTDIARKMLDNNSKILAVTTQQPYKLGYDAVKNAVSICKGEKVDSVVEIPTITYTNEDKAGLEEYIKTHERFEKK